MKRLLSDRTYKPILDFMTNIGIYREGGLPPFSRSFSKIDLRILRCSYWKVFYWQHDTLIAPYWRVYWNSRSGASISLNDKNYDLNADFLYLIPPNTHFSTNLDINPERADRNFLMGCPANNDEEQQSGLKSIDHFFIHFTTGLPCDRIKGAVYQIPFSAESQKVADTIKAKLEHPAGELDMQAVFSIRALINLLLMTIPGEHWPEDIVDSRIRDIIEFIEKNYAQQIQNSEMADLVHMSENGFSRLFKKNTGKSPKDYLIDRRLDHACNLLHHSNYSIDEIAGLCGFCDRSYFSRMFIKKFSSGPAKFRKTAFIS